MATALAAELERELGPGHPLKNKKVRAVARRFDCDDVLFVLTEEMPSCAVVHLAYAGREKSPKWPDTRIFASLDDWKREGMMPDHNDYHADEVP
ncbi:MAG: hypothetical protein JSS11_10475 [Verrucomicrobia bacterium]|nr:hypothetical protein [Verrucomicrobiota bacterium]